MAGNQPSCTAKKLISRYEPTKAGMEDSKVTIVIEKLSRPPDFSPAKIPIDSPNPNIKTIEMRTS
jgi:hypothetical protein